MSYNQEVVKIINKDISFEKNRKWLESFIVRTNNVLPKEYWEILDKIKRDAISEKNENIAKACWCFEIMGEAQDQFIATFLQAREDDFYTSWCTLEQCEILINSLERHFPINNDNFGLAHIKLYTNKFQKLFPYEYFTSPGMVVKTAKCSICNQPFKLRGGCEHIVGEIYEGKMCHRILEEIELLEVSIVENPVQKYSVIFSPDIVYDYGSIKYLVEAVKSPWHPWEVDIIETTKEMFPGIGRNEVCSCGSGKKYKKCCLQTPKQHTHYEFTFKYPPPVSLPNYLADGSYKIKGKPSGFKKDI